MLFDQKAVARIRAAMTASPIVASSWARVSNRMSLKQPDEALELESTYKHLKERYETYGGNKSFSLGNHVRNISHEAKELSFYYRMTGEQQTLRLIVSLIRMVDREEQWVYQLGSARKSDLWTADIGVNMAIALSAIEHELQEEERAVIADHIYKKAFLPLFEDWLHPAKRIHALDTMGHNWWMVCVAGAGILLLLCGDQWENRDQLLEIIAESMEEWFRYPGNVLQNKQANFGADGDYIEFMAYLDYSLYHYVIFCELYYKKTGTIPTAGETTLRKLPQLYDATLYATKEGWKWLHFGDTKIKTSNGFIWLYMASRLQDDRMLNYFMKLKEELTESLEFYFYPEHPAKISNNNESWEKGRERESQHLLLEHTGIAVIRSRQQEAASQELYFAIKTGEAWNHNHLDAGTFVLVAGGNEFIVDSGHCSYSKPQYSQYYCSSQAHNVVLHEGQGIPAEASYAGTKFPGRIPVLLSAGDYCYLLADCTGPYTAIYERFYRHVLFIGGNIMMIDDLYARQEGNFEWRLHVKGEVQAADGKITITNNDQLVVENLYPLDKKYDILPGYLHADQGGDYFPEGDIVQLSTTDASRRAKFVNVFLAPWEIKNGARTEAFGDERCLGVKLFRGGMIEEVYINPAADGSVMHENSILHWGDIKTDGFIARISMDEAGTVSEVSLHNGSFLHYRGVCLFSSLLKCDAVLKYGDEFQLQVELSEDTWCYFSEDGVKGTCLSKQKLRKGSRLVCRNRLADSDKHI